jgi:hypothetical protein
MLVELRPFLRLLDQMVRIGRNNTTGWEFYVGQRANRRWVGFALRWHEESGYVLIAPSVTPKNPSEEEAQKHEVARATAAVAMNPEHGFGGVDDWTVIHGLRIIAEDSDVGV